MGIYMKQVKGEFPERVADGDNMENRLIYEPETGNSQKYNLKRDIWEWVESIAISVTTLIFIFVFVFRIVGISGQSMEDTLHHDDRVIISSLFYTPQRGDIVVINQPNELNEPIIKRIIALGGQTVDIDFETGEVRVDGELLEEPYISSPTTNAADISFPVTVPEGKVFVMGDNRQHSTDSRNSMIGMIDTRYILGRAVFRIFPFDQIGALS